MLILKNRTIYSIINTLIILYFFVETIIGSILIKEWIIESNFGSNTEVLHPENGPFGLRPTSIFYEGTTNFFFLLFAFLIHYVFFRDHEIKNKYESESLFYLFILCISIRVLFTSLHEMMYSFMRWEIYDLFANKDHHTEKFSTGTNVLEYFISISCFLIIVSIIKFYMIENLKNKTIWEK